MESARMSSPVPSGWGVMGYTASDRLISRRPYTLGIQAQVRRQTLR